jgi:hypothetical protein
MNDTERYLFDLQGYVHLPGFLTEEATSTLYDAALALEQEALAARATGSRWISRAASRKPDPEPDYWQHPEHGYFAKGTTEPGDTVLVEDFWLSPSAFDFLIGHEPTLACITRVIRGKIAIDNSELRIRYPGNATGMHMGFPQGHASKYRYNVLENEIDCVMVRIVYFLHDVGVDEGPICFVPGSHKSAFPVPVDVPVDEEPGVVPLAVKAGDAVLFTEACRHGGFANLSATTRYTLHVGYGPSYLPSQNHSTMDEWPNATPALLERLSQEQRDLLVPRGRLPAG